MRLAILTIILAFGLTDARAQYAPSASGSPVAAAEINGKINHREGSGAPSSNCTVGKDVYTDTAAGSVYWCSATNTWTKLQAGMTAASVVALFSSCSGTQYLGADLACHTVGGGGDASTNTSTSVVNEVSLFADTGGKTFKRASLTGLAKLTSGVLSAATAGTDYAAATNGTSGQALTSNGAGGFGTALTLAPIATSGSAADLTAGAIPAARMPALTGDLTTPAGSVVTTLATVNGGPGSCGDATHVCQVTTNGKGLVTAQSAVSISGATTRTWPYTYQGNVQASAAGFSMSIPAASAPVITFTGSTVPIAVLQYPTAQSTYYSWANFTLPTGYVSNAVITYAVDSECDTATTCDSTRAARLIFGLACSSTVVSNPTFTDAAAVSVTNAAAGAPTTTTGTLTPNAGGLPACAAGQIAWVRVKVDTSTNSLTGAFNLSRLYLSVQGGM